MKFKSEPFVKLTRLLVIAIAVAGLQACTSGGALSGGTVNNPFHREEPQPPVPSPQPPVPYDGHVRDLGFWLNSSRETAPFTSFVTHYIDLDQDPAQWASLIDPTDTRKIVWSITAFTYGPTPRSRNGYTLRPDFGEKWQAVKALIANHLDRTLAAWVGDEFDAVACGDELDTDGKSCGTPGDVDWNPNLYNGDLSTVAAIIHADLPQLAVGINYGSVPALLQVPSGITLVGLEAYGVDWLANLRNLEAKTAAPIWLLAPAFATGNPEGQDARLAQIVRDQFEYAKTDARVTGFYPFLWCCDDTVTGTRDFFTVSGGRLPLTQQAIVDVGTVIVTGAR